MRVGTIIDLRSKRALPIATREEVQIEADGTSLRDEGRRARHIALSSVRGPNGSVEPSA
jgi:hypothetical protein